MGFCIIEAPGEPLEILGDEVGQAAARDFLKERTGNPYRDRNGRLHSQYDRDLSDSYGE